MRIFGIVLFLAACHHISSRDAQVVTIGFLLQNETQRDIYPLDLIDGARYALADWAPLFKFGLNVSLNLLPVIQPSDSDSSNAGLSTALNFVRQGASVLLGGGGPLSCTSYIGTAGYYKVPIMSITGCLDSSFLDKSSYPTFARMYGSSSVAFAGRDMYLKFNVSTPQLIMLDAYRQAIGAAKMVFESVGVFQRPFMILDPSASAETIRGLLKQIKAAGDRWIVLFLPHALARNVLIEMDREGMNSGFAVLQTGMTPTNMYDPTDTPERNAAAIRAVDGLFSLSNDRNLIPSFTSFANRLNASTCARGSCMDTFDVTAATTTSLLYSADVYDSVSMACYALFTLLNSTTATINPQNFGTDLFRLMLRPYLGLTGYSIFAPSGEKLNDLIISTMQGGKRIRFASYSIVSGTRFEPSLKVSFRGGDVTPPPNNSPVPCNPGYFGTGGMDCYPCGVGSFNPNLSARQCELCPAGSYQPYQQQTSCIACPEGSITRQKGLNACIPCDPGKYVSKNGSSECDTCPINTNNFQSLRLLYEGRLRNFVANNLTDCTCIAGTSGPNGKACSVCDADTSFCCFCGLDEALQIENLKTKGVPCEQCLSGVELPMPKKGHVLSLSDNIHGAGRPSDTVGPVIIPCHSEKACFGGPRSQCEEGYEGVRCGKCQLGYSAQSSGCTKCVSSGRASAVFVILCLMPFIITLILLEMSCRRVSLAAMAVVNYMIDILYIISSIRIQWPNYISKIFIGSSFLNFDIQIFSPDCAREIFRNFQTKIGVTLALPLIFWGMHLVYFLTLLALRAITGNLEPHPDLDRRRAQGRIKILHLFYEPLPVVIRRFLSSSIRIMILLFPQTTTTSFSYFQCLQLSDGAVKSVQIPSINCYSSEWYSMLWAPIMALIAYNFVFPLTSWILLQRYSKSTRAESGPGFEVLWTFTLEYAPSAAYWGIVELVHFTLLLLSVSLFKSGVHQACAVVVLLIIHFLWGMRQLPYKSKFDNDLQAMMGIGLVSIVALGIVIDQDWTKFSVDFSDIACVIIVCSLFAVNFYALFRDAKHTVHRRRTASVYPINSDQLFATTPISPSIIDVSTPVERFKSDDVPRAVEASNLEMGVVKVASNESIPVQPFQGFDIESQLSLDDATDSPPPFPHSDSSSKLLTQA